jgi:hypothetical protein
MFRPNGVIIRLACKTFIVLETILIMTPWGRNMQLSTLLLCILTLVYSIPGVYKYELNKFLSHSKY